MPRPIRVETSALTGRRSGEIDHPPREVDGMVAKTLIEARHQRHLHRHRQYHASRCELRDQAGVQLAHLVMTLAQRQRDSTVAVAPGIPDLAPHAPGQIPHPLDKPSTARRKVRTETVTGPRGNLHDEVVGTL